MLFRVDLKEAREAESDHAPEVCDCLRDHLEAAEAARHSLKTRCAFVGSFCPRCVRAYWTFVDSARMTSAEDISRATKTKCCPEAELHDIAYEWIMRAYHLGIPKQEVEVRIGSL